MKRNVGCCRVLLPAFDVGAVVHWASSRYGCLCANVYARDRPLFNPMFLLRFFVMSLTSKLAYLTANTPGIGGVIKQRPADFLVEEQPKADFTDEGEHLILFIEKENLTTSEVVRRVAKAFRIPRQRIGYAGMKDKHAITRQHFSLHLPDSSQDEQGLHRLGHQQRIKVLWSTRHSRKIRRGYHGGNRFVIRIRNVEPTAAIHTKRMLDRLTETGIPNYIGDQRFGYRQNGHQLGRAILLDDPQALVDGMLGGFFDEDTQTLQRARAAYNQGDYEEAMRHWPRQLRFDRQALDALRQGKTYRQAMEAIDRSQREFLVCAFQSAVFNDVLDQRLREQTFCSLLPGDLAWKHDNGAIFAVDAATAEMENQDGGRVASQAVSPSGPMWGADMPQPDGRVLKMERAALARYDVTEAQLAGLDDVRAEGRRRPLRVFLRDPDVSGGVDEHGPFVRVAFELQRGAFATMVLREIMKTDMHTAVDSSD